MNCLFLSIKIGLALYRSRPGLLGLLFFLGLINFVWGMVGVLAQPMVLGFASPAALDA